MNRRTAGWTFAASLAAVSIAASCNQLAGIREGIPLEENETPPPECATPADCVADEPACRAAVACDAGQCLFDDALEGTPLPSQVDGDCAELVCDGAGRAKLIPLATDTPDDGDVCTLDACQGATPEHTPHAALPCYSGPPGTEGKGICVAGVQHCDPTGNPVGDCEGEEVPGTETCFSPLDDDCDGKANEEGPGCTCEPGELAPCYTASAGTQGVGACHGGMQGCNEDGLGYGPCVGQQTPEAETCDAGEVDEDCDGEVNEEGVDCECGDGYVSVGEACDDGNPDPTDLCTPACESAVCGDGILQPVAGEGCDDGGTSDGDPCSPTCQQQEVLMVAAGYQHTCALLNDGSVKCWGQNTHGQLGLGDTASRGDGPGEMGYNLPSVNLDSGKTAVALVAGTYHTCALLNDDSLKCWGGNPYGQLGLGDINHRGDNPGEMGDALPTVKLFSDLW